MEPRTDICALLVASYFDPYPVSAAEARGLETGAAEGSSLELPPPFSCGMDPVESSGFLVAGSPSICD